MRNILAVVDVVRRNVYIAYLSPVKANMQVCSGLMQVCVPENQITHCLYLGNTANLRRNSKLTQCLKPANLAFKAADISLRLDSPLRSCGSRSSHSLRQLLPLALLPRRKLGHRLLLREQRPPRLLFRLLRLHAPGLPQSASGVCRASMAASITSAPPASAHTRSALLRHAT